MTIPEAIKFCEGYLPECDTKKYVIEQLRKLEPKPPLDTTWIYCPVCGHAFGLWGEVKRCPDCFQVIDWGIDWSEE